MLGIRQYKGAAIDLFQGDVLRFVCDVLIVAEKLETKTSAKEVIAVPPLEKGFGSDALAACYLEILQRVEVLQKRHVTFQTLGVATMSPRVVAGVAFSALRQHLDERKVESKVKRFTFLLEDGEQYREFQEALFAEFE